MYICVCNAIREDDLRKAARGCDGKAMKAKDVYASLGKQPNCGQCLCGADKIIREERCELVAL